MDGSSHEQRGIQTKNVACTSRNSGLDESGRVWGDLMGILPLRGDARPRLMHACCACTRASPYLVPRPVQTSNSSIQILRKKSEQNAELYCKLEDAQLRNKP
jgi:hypothetical protein